LADVAPFDSFTDLVGLPEHLANEKRYS
jgi:hypothetical protein